jgi:hypothetical protein
LSPVPSRIPHCIKVLLRPQAENPAPILVLLPKFEGIALEAEKLIYMSFNQGGSW